MCSNENPVGSNTGLQYNRNRSAVYQPIPSTTSPEQPPTLLGVTVNNSTHQSQLHQHSPPSVVSNKPSNNQPQQQSIHPNNLDVQSSPHHQQATQPVPPTCSTSDPQPPQSTTVATAAGMSMLTVPPALLPLDHYRLQLYNYAMAERLRCSQYATPLPMCPPYPSMSPYGPRLALSMSLFHNRVFQPEEPKPQHSYIGLIAMAILSSPELKLVLSDIYQHILDNYPYFRSRGPGWRNSIRHNLSLNDCFVKAGRSANGKGHYWSIHSANEDDFRKGDFRRRKAQRKVRKHMGLAVDDEGTDSPSPPPLSVTPPPPIALQQLCPAAWADAATVATAASNAVTIYSQSRKRQFDVASLLAPDEDHGGAGGGGGGGGGMGCVDNQGYHRTAAVVAAAACKRFAAAHHHHHHHHHHMLHNSHHHLHHSHVRSASADIDEDIDVVASDQEGDKEIMPVLMRRKLMQQQQHSIGGGGGNGGGDSSSGACSVVDDGENSESAPLSPTDDDNQSVITQGSSNAGATWQGLLQQWPTGFSQMGAAVAGVDPRILGRYYGQYMAAAQASRRLSIGTSAGEPADIPVSIPSNNC